MQMLESSKMLERPQMRRTNTVRMIKLAIKCQELTKRRLGKIRGTIMEIKTMKSLKQIQRSWKEMRQRMKSFEIISTSCKRLEVKEEGLNRQSGDLKVIWRQFLRLISRAITSPQPEPTYQPRSCSTKSITCNNSKTSKPQTSSKAKRDWTRSWCLSSLRSLIQEAQPIITRTPISSALAVEAQRKTLIQPEWFLSSATPRWINYSFLLTSSLISTLKKQSVQDAAMAQGPIPLNRCLCRTDRFRCNRWRLRRILCIQQAMIAVLELRAMEAQIIRSARSSHRSATNDSVCLLTRNWQSWANRISKVITRVIWVNKIETRGVFERILEVIPGTSPILGRSNSTLQTHHPIKAWGMMNRFRLTKA